MKKYIFHSVKQYVFYFFFLSFIYACSPMDYHYKDLIKKGDRIYVGKIDSTWTFAGENRLKIVWNTPSDPSITMIRVFWNNNTDSIEYLSNTDNRLDTGAVLIENLPEGLHTLYIKSFDELGNQSLKVEVTAKTYGSKFQNVILNRTIESFNIKNGLTTIKWNEEFSETMVKTELNYYDNSGQAKTAFIRKEDKELIITDIDVQKDVHFRSWHIPETLALDTFKTEYKYKRL